MHDAWDGPALMSKLHTHTYARTHTTKSCGPRGIYTVPLIWEFPSPRYAQHGVEVGQRRGWGGGVGYREAHPLGLPYGEGYV